MARKYSRDNRGRFASSGTGATARGGRLKTASGNKRATQTSQMTAAPRAGTVGKGGKVRGAVKPAATAKPTQAPGSRIRAPKTGGVSRARLSGQKMNEGAGKRGAARQQRQQTMAIQRQMLGRVKPAKSAEPLATGGTLAARASMGRARAKAGSGASPAQRGAVTRAGTYLKASRERNRTAVKGAMPKGTVAKPKGLKQGAVTARVNARAVAAKPAVAKAKSGKKPKIDDGKVYRVTGRLNNVVRNSEQKTGVKRLNAIQVGQRAKTFLARKEGGSVGILNQKSQPEAYASVRKAMTKPPRYSTQKPNRNKPGRFNDLGQDKARVKARRDAMTVRDKIQETNKLAAVKTKAQKSNLSSAAIRGGALSRRELGYSNRLRDGFTRAARMKGTVPKPRQEPKVSTTTVRTRSQAKAAQRNRREQILNNTRFSKVGVWRMKNNPRIRAVNTGMSQLSLVGKAKTLKRYRPVK